MNMLTKNEKEKKLKELAKNFGVKYVDEKRNDLQIFEDDLVTNMYMLERLMGYQITPEFPLAKFFLLIEEAQKDESLKKK